jgi:23S rRNA maturation mini-RNase III
MRTPAIGNSRAYGRFVRRRLALAGFLLASAWLALWPAAAGAGTLPAFPQAFVDTTYSLPTGGNTIAVHAGGDLQAAINSANLGDVIVVDAGATFNAPINLPNKTTGSGWIYVISSAYASLPAPGNRVSPADAVNMPKIVINDGTSDSAVQTDEGAHHFRFVGFEFAPAPGQFVYAVTVGGLLETSVSQLPHDIIFDRCYVHGDPTVGGRRGIQLDAVRGAVIDSYFKDFMGSQADTQAVWALNTPGPLKIVNNYLEASGENLLLGGDDPTIVGNVPSDVEIRHNHFFKPLSWINDPANWTVKNLLELKLGVRVLIEGNVFENNWQQAQDGEGIVITPRNQNHTAPWSTTQDITVRLNQLVNVGKGMDISGYDDTAPDRNQPINVQTQRVLVENNLFDVTGLQGATARIFQLTHGAANLTVRHNTGSTITVGGVSAIAANQDGSDVISPKGDQFDFRDNLLGAGGNGGFFGDAIGEGTSALTTFFTNWTFLDNAIYSNATRGPIDPTWYPPNNFFLADASAVGFVNYADPLTNFAGGNYALAPTSPLKNAASDGLDIGADIAANTSATSCACAGACGSDPPGPTISGVAATAITGTSATIVWTTDLGATTRVEYGFTSAYGSSIMDAALVFSHSQGLSGLLPATTYHYRVSSSDGTGNSAISGDFTFTTERAVATVNLLSSQNPSMFGQTVTVTATVSGNSGSPSGTVTFYDNGTAMSACTALPLSGGVAQCASTLLAIGVHPISVTYSGDAIYPRVTSSTFIQTVKTAVVTFNVGSNLNPSMFGQAVTLTATLTGSSGTPSGTVTFYDNGTAISACTALTLAGGAAPCTTASLGVGLHPVTIAYSGDAIYPRGTSSTFTQTIKTAVVTINVGSSLNPSMFGQAVTLTASLTGSSGTPSGTVTFYDNGTAIAACTVVPLFVGVAQCSAALLAVGAHPITVTYSGDAIYPRGTSSTLTQTVKTAVVAFSIGSNLNPSTFSQAVTLTATLTGTSGTPSGTVTFYDNGTAIAACTALALSGGTAQCTTALLGVGLHPITVTYSGDAIYPRGTSSTLTQTVQTAVASLNIASSLNPSTFSQAVALTATLTGSAGTLPSGTVTFYDNGTAIGFCTALPLSNGAAQCTTGLLSVGLHPITLTYSGDGIYPRATSGTFTQTVKSAVASFNIGSSLNPSTVSQTVTLTATLTGSAVTPPSGTVNFYDNGLAIPGCSSLALSADLVHSSGLGQCTTASLVVGVHPITVTYSGDAIYPRGTSSTFAQTVRTAVIAVSVVATPEPSIWTQAVSLTAMISGNVGLPSGTATFYDNGVAIAGCISVALLPDLADAAGVAQCTTASFAVGLHPITVTYSGDTTYPRGTSPTFTHTVQPTVIAFSVGSAPSPSIWTQDVTLTATISGNVVALPSGTATFYDNGVAIPGCSSLALSPDLVNSAGVARCTIASLVIGVHPVTVTYSGDTTYPHGTSPAFTHTVQPAVIAFSVGSLPDNVSTWGGEVTLVVGVSGNVGPPTGTVTFYDNGGVIPGCTAVPLLGVDNVAECTTSSLAVGVHTIFGVYSGETTYPHGTSPAWFHTVKP